MVSRNGSIVTKSNNLPVQLVDLTDKIFRSDGSLHASVTYSGVAATKHESIITYTTSPRGDRRKANTCRQQTTDLTCRKLISSGSYSGLSPTGTYSFESPSGGLTFYPFALDAALLALGPNGYGVLGGAGQGYVNDAFAQLKPDLTELSLPNFLLELDEIPRLFQLWKKDLSLLRNLANARLNWSFGWKPLVSDVESILSVIKSVRGKLVAWNNMVGQRTKRSKTFQVSPTSASGSTTAAGGGWTIYWNAHRTSVVRAYLTFVMQRIPAVESALTIMRGYLDAFGFELNPRIVWDAIPFSFVLDWFFDVGGWLNRHKYDTLELPIMLEDSYLQYKEELTISFYAVNSSPLHSPPITTQTFEVRRKTFQRMPLYPDQSAATAAGWHIPSVNQLTNLVSLALTR